VAVFVAGVFDGVDGRVARMTGTSSEFGVQYDSLADLVSFGMAPALVMYHWALSDDALDGAIVGKIGWLAAFLYVACAALRLARFNTQVGVVDKRWFIGLNSPSSAGLMMGFVGPSTTWAGFELRTSRCATIACALRGRPDRYTSFKGDRRARALLGDAVVGFLVRYGGPPQLSRAAAYAVSGPLYWLLMKFRRGEPPHELGRHATAHPARARPRADAAGIRRSDAFGRDAGECRGPVATPKAAPYR
jgi:CDP-diacylglycerol--serine O-phosphatidyltransferase